MSWFTKIVEVEKTVEIEKVVTVLGSPEQVTLYRASKVEWAYALLTSVPCRRALGYYHSCEQAFMEHPSAEVDVVHVWKAGDIYLTDLKVTEIKVQPKSKREKGKGRAAA